MIRGVGPVYAKKLVRPFGENVFDVIETTMVSGQFFLHVRNIRRR